MANHNSTNSRKSRNLVGAGLLLVIAHVGATACGPEFDSCEDRHTCKPTGGSAGMSGSGGGAGAPDSGATGGGASNGGSAGEANVGEGGASGGGGRTTNGGTAPGTSGAAGESSEEGGRSQAGAGGVDRGGAPTSGGTTGGGVATGGSHATGGSVATGGSHATGGTVATGGIDGGGGEGGDDAGGAPGTDCSAGDTVLCSQLFGAGPACSGRTVACENGRWPTTCIDGARDCTSAEDNDCDGKADNTEDETCVCAPGATQQCDPTPTDAGECESGLALCVLRAGNASSYWGTCKPRTEAAPSYKLNRVRCPDNTLLDAACTKTSGPAGTMQPKCIEYPNTCGYLYCM